MSLNKDELDKLNGLDGLGGAAHEPLSGARELDGVIGTALAVAQEQLTEQGGLMPFAVVLENQAATQRRIELGDDAPDDDEPSLRLVVVAPEGDEDEVDGEETVAALVEAVRAQRDDLTAVAIVSDVTLTEENSDAVHVEAEHLTGGVAAVLMPYQLGTHGPEWRDLEGDGSAERRIWID